MKQIQSLALVGGMLLAFGCGGDSDDGDGDGNNPGGGAPPAIDSGQPETTQIQSLTPQQFTSACESLRDDVAQRLGPDVTTRGTCEAYGAGLSDDPSTCRSAADGCVTQVNNGTHPFINREDLDFTTVECGSDTSQLQGCGATVGDLETCLVDQVTTVEQLFADNGCDDAASVSPADLTMLVSSVGVPPASCTRLQAQCPGLDIAAPAP